MDPQRVREIAIQNEPKHRRLIRFAADGRRLSTAQLHFFLLAAPPAGFGVITTTGAKTGKPRRKCVRVIRVGDTAFLVALRPPAAAIANPFDFGECLTHLRGRPTRAKIKALHAYWFDTGIPIAIDLEPEKDD